MNNDVNAIIKAGENALNIRTTAIAHANRTYNSECNILSDKLKSASDITCGDTIVITGGYRHKGKQARVQEVGFIMKDVGVYVYAPTKGRYASAHVSLLKKDGSLGKISVVIQLQHLRKV